MHDLIAVLLLLSPAGDPSDWPQWRGAEGDGLSHGTPWSSEGRTVWTVEIGLGYSAPSVQGARVVTLGFDAERSLDVLRCLDGADGRERWRAETPGELRANQHEGGTLSTPAIQGEHVFASSNDGLLSCYRLEDGAQVWRVDLAKRFEVNPGYYGFASSPVLVGDTLLIACDRVVALRAADGETVWATEPIGAQYSTPVPCELGGEARVAVLSQNALHLLERASGKELASFPWHKSDRLVNAATPVVVGEQVFVSTAYDHGCALVEFGADGARARFQNLAMRNKMAGCVLVGDALFGFDESVLKCLDLAGEERWRLRGLGNGAIGGGDGKLAVLSSSGELVVARASNTSFEELARVPLFEEGVCWTPPVIAAGRLYLRNNRGTLLCRDHRGAEKAAKPAPVAAAGAKELPTAEALFAAHRKAVSVGRTALPANLRLSGVYEQRSVGFVPVPFVILQLGPERRRVEIQLPPPIEGWLARVFDGELVFERNPYRGDKLYSPAEEREEALAARAFPARCSGEFAPLGGAARTTGTRVVDERPCFVVETTAADGTRRELYFDRASGLLAGRSAENEALVTYSDYRELEGFFLATTERYFRPDTGIEETFRIERVAVLADDFEPDAALFERSPEIEALLAERKGGAKAQEPR